MKKLLTLSLLLLSFVQAYTQSSKNKNEVYYEIFIRSFYDSNGDGIGDINGIRQKLNYLQNLGITGIWVTPIHPSPTYHKYDIMDYYGIDKEYGTIEEYKQLVIEAHQKGIKILIDLVVNHTSSEHPWFRASCKNDPKYKDFYVWSKTETGSNWHKNPLNPNEKYFAFFWEKMPDLNFDNKEVREEVKKIGRYWLKDIGVDGYRIDAAQHVYEPNDVVKNNIWWTEFRNDMLKVNPNVYLLGEVWNKDSIVATYFKSSLDGCFNFDLSKAIIQSVEKNDASNFANKLQAIHQLYKSYNPNFRDVIFISNHDQDRYRSTFNGDTAKTKLAFAMLMTLPGIPFLYYGEEIGMLGKSPDEYRREPFLWGKNDAGNTTWEKPRYSNESNVNAIDVQMDSKNSFYSFYKSMIGFRKANSILSEGEVTVYIIPNFSKQIISYQLINGNETCYVMHNLSLESITISQPEFKNKKIHAFNEASYSNDFKLTLPPYSSVVIK
jgi:glycosidase